MFGAGFEPAKLRLSTVGVCQLRHPNMVDGAGLEPALFTVLGS